LIVLGALSYFITLSPLLCVLLLAMALIVLLYIYI
jgi:hypothetical protein